MENNYTGVNNHNYPPEPSTGSHGYNQPAHQQNYPGYHAHPGAPVMPPPPGGMTMPGLPHGSPIHQSPHMQSQPIVIIQQSASPVHTNLGPSSSFAKCPSCQASGYTRAERGFNCTGWVICFLLYIFTLICFWCATCCESNYEVRHYCSNCGYRIGTYNG